MGYRDDADDESPEGVPPTCCDFAGEVGVVDTEKNIKMKKRLYVNQVCQKKLKRIIRKVSAQEVSTTTLPLLPPRPPRARCYSTRASTSSRFLRPDALCSTLTTRPQKPTRALPKQRHERDATRLRYEKHRTRKKLNCALRGRRLNTTSLPPEKKSTKTAPLLMGAPEGRRVRCFCNICAKIRLKTKYQITNRVSIKRLPDLEKATLDFLKINEGATTPMNEMNEVKEINENSHGLGIRYAIKKKAKKKNARRKTGESRSKAAPSSFLQRNRRF